MPRKQKRVLIVVILIAIAGAGFLCYDWYAVTQKQAPEPQVTLYSWTDENGATHFTDFPPPKTAIKVKKFEGYDHVRAPMLITARDKSVDIFGKFRKIWKKYFGTRDKEP